MFFFILRWPFLQIWGITLFALFCFLCYEQGLKNWERDYAKLRESYAELIHEKKRLTAIQEDLALQINSQSDPAWVELVLMKGLGLVPEGHTKVYFSPRS